MDAEDPPNLLGMLPPELLYRIARSLSTTDLCALRLSCRPVERALFHPFGREFFTRKQFMISEFSLQALIDIAMHRELHLKLEHVSFGLEMLGDAPRHWFSTAEKSRFFHAARCDHSTIFSSGRAVEMLTEAFANLPNLKTVSIRDKNSRTRFRDFNSGIKEWTSYGQPTFRRNTDNLMTLCTSMDRSNFLSSVFNAVITALIRARARPESIEVMLWKKDIGLQDTSFWVPPRMRAEQEAMLSRLRKLHLCIDPELTMEEIRRNINDRRPHVQPRYDRHSDRVGTFQSGANCRQFIAAAARSLTNLRINFHRKEHLAVDNFMTHFTQPQPGTNRTDEVVFPMLKQLDLGRARATLPSLHAIIKGLPSIEVLCLHAMVIMSTPAFDLRSESLLQTLIRRLPTTLPNLRHVDIHRVKESTGPIALNPVALDKDKTTFTFVLREGENRQEQFDNLAGRLTLVCAMDNLSMVDDDFESDESDEDDEEEEDDDDDDDDDD